MNEDLSMVGKIVKVVDGSVNTLGLVQFMYPDYIPVEELRFNYEDNVLYLGKYSSDLKERLDHGTKSFIAVSSVGLQDIDFTSRDTQLKVLFSKWNRRIPKTVQNAVESMTDEEFYDFFKRYWVIGKSKFDSSDVTLWDLYKVLGKNRSDIFKVYYSLMENFSDVYIMSGVLSFIEKSMNVDMVSSSSGKYLMLLNDFNKSFGGSIRKILYKVYKMKVKSDEDREKRLKYLLYSIGKGAI